MKKTFSIPSHEAWSAIYPSLIGESPVDAVFSMPTIHNACMVVRVDGQPMDIYINLNRDGTWTAVYCVGGVPQHMKGKQ